MPTVILKKTFKMKPGAFRANIEKSFSFHGSIPADMMKLINQVLKSNIHVSSGANVLQFQMDEHGHYKAFMNHESQKHHEEDFVVSIMDIMEQCGWTFRFQYDTSIMSQYATHGSMTDREMFVFQKEQK